jgi:ribosomal protein S18 acetylase RimI-like enzyme
VTNDHSTRLRRGTLDDVPRLKELGVLGWETTYPFVSPENRANYLAGPFWSLDRLRAIVANDHCLTLVAEAADGTANGFLTIEPVGEGVVELTRFYVDPSTRGSGLGQALFTAGLDWSRDTGARTMIVNVFGDNEGGRRFYERHGFVLTRLEPYTIGDQIVDDAWYELQLLGVGR